MREHFFHIFIFLELIHATRTSTRKVRVHLGWPHRNLRAPFFEAIDCNLCLYQFSSYFILFYKASDKFPSKKCFPLERKLNSTLDTFFSEINPFVKNKTTTMTISVSKLLIFTCGDLDTVVHTYINFLQSNSTNKQTDNIGQTNKQQYKTKKIHHILT